MSGVSEERASVGLVFSGGVWGALSNAMSIEEEGELEGDERNRGPGRRWVGVRGREMGCCCAVWHEM